MMLLRFLLAMPLVLGINEKTLKTNPSKLSKRYYMFDDRLICRKCSPGQYVSSPCEKNHGVSKCEPCHNNTYMSNKNDQIGCYDCTICQTTQIEIQKCSAVQNRKCQCPSGTYWEEHRGISGGCFRHKVCDGTILLKEGTPWNDTVCGESANIFDTHSTLQPETTSDSKKTNPFIPSSVTKTTPSNKKTISCVSDSTSYRPWVNFILGMLLGVLLTFLFVGFGFCYLRTYKREQVVKFFQKKDDYDDTQNSTSTELKELNKISSS